MTPTTRRATADDASALAELAERTFRSAFRDGNDPRDMAIHCEESFSPAIQGQEIENSDWATLVSEHAGELIAFAQVRLGSEKACVPASRPVELYRLYVSSEWHGRGIAQQLMREVFAVAATANSDWIWLGVWECNPRAQAFYRKFGFEVVGDHVFQFGSDPQRDLIMARPIESTPLD